MDGNPARAEQGAGQPREDQNSHRGSPDPPAKVSEEPKAHALQSGTGNKNVRRKPLTRFEIWTIVLGFIGIFVTGATGLAIYWQDRIASRTLYEMQKQYPELQKSADAAKEAADLSRQELRAADGAVLHLGRPFSFDPERQQIFIDFSNWGHSTASHINARLKISIIQIPSMRSARTYKTEIQLPNLVSSPPNEPNARRSQFQWPIGNVVTAPEIGMLKGGLAALKTDLITNYYDGFGTVTDKTCYAYLHFEIPQRNGSSSGGGTIPCDQFTSAYVAAFSSQLQQARIEANAQQTPPKPN
ncbi:MAG TPA: hypothetical protein VN661_01700 [Candidatus Acidoferrales bacterium]|nr:hypothetical protein [Candidatus Acidoferrales bacterium]